MSRYSNLTQFTPAIHALADYAEYNYGLNHRITAACRSGDPQAFMDATTHITEMHDMRIVQLQNKLICALPVIWCNQCGAKTATRCTCPIADNE
jgi:hypothetical protein